MKWDIGIDLGTQSVRVAELNDGPVMSASAALAFREGNRVPICAGDIAERLVGRACQGVEVVYLPRTPEISSSQIKRELYDANAVDGESKTSHDDIDTDPKK